MDLIHYLAVIKGGNKFIFRYGDGDETEILRSVMGYVRDPNCILDTSDAVQIIIRLRNEMSKNFNKKAIHYKD